MPRKTNSTRTSSRSAKTTSRGRGRKAFRVMTREQYEAQAAEPVADAPATELAETTAADTASAATADMPADKAKRASGLDAAAQILAEAGGPMSIGEVVKQMLARGLWTTSGKTPAATIYSAVIREITTKGSKSRFRKMARGQFEFTGVKED